MKVDLFKKLQQEMRNQGLLTVHNKLGAATIIVETILFTFLLFVLALVDQWAWAYWFMQLLGGVLIFHWFVVAHECGHKTLFIKSFWNTVFGHIASVFCLIPYFAWRNLHLLHHRWVGVIDKDPTQKDLLKLRQIGKVQNMLFNLVWKLWLPIPFVKFLFEVFWLYPLECRKKGDSINFWLGCFSLCVCIVPHFLLIIVVGLGTWASYFVPMLMVFYVLIENMNLPQHSELFPYLSDTHPDPVPLAEQDLITRSTYLPDWLSVVIALNFNRHTEHHLFPAAPWYSLNKVRRSLIQAGYVHPHEVQFLSFMWRFRGRDPLTIYRDALPHPVGGQK